jgi:hypothetical protein
LDADTIGTYNILFNLVDKGGSTGTSPAVTLNVICDKEIDDPYDAKPIEIS